MTSVQRLTPSGSTYFFTVRLQDSRSDLLVSHINLLRHAFLVARQKHPFEIGPCVILPNRMHLIWTLPPGDRDYSRRWRLIKSTFARHLPNVRHRSREAIARRKNGVWQRRFWEHAISNSDEYEMYERLIRDAPVDEGLVKRAEDWQHSSFARKSQEMPPPIIARAG